MDTPPDLIVARQADRVYVPTLSEIIEACVPLGELFQFGVWRDGTWTAGIRPITRGYWVYGKGSTPTEAVARLWLSLNRKV